MNPGLLPMGMFGGARKRAAPAAIPDATQVPLGFGDKLGMAGSILLNNYDNGAGQPFMQMYQARQQQALEAQRHAQERQDAQDSWLFQQQWEREHPKPIVNDTVNDYNFRADTLGKPAADDWLRSAGDPIVTVNLPGDRVYSGPRSGLGAALSGEAAPAQPAPAHVTFTPIPGGAGPQTPHTFPSPMSAIIQRESGGRVGVVGPPTPYGRAEGLTQMLPGTARQMASKLGVPWQPSLMTATSSAGADYQRRLGEAYFDQGLSETGNMRDALRYYHGGPNRRMWGPKTNRYADSIMAQLGGGQ